MVARLCVIGACPTGWDSAQVADPRDCPIYPTTAAIDAKVRSGDDLRFKDWTECRTAIARLDALLVDLRKLGFSLITTLLAASAFLGFIGVGAPTFAPDGTRIAPAIPSIEARTLVFVTIMVLVATLFALDTYYSVLLDGAVERALDVEVQTDPWIRVTKYLSYNVMKSGAIWVTLFLYLLVLAMSYSWVRLMLNSASGADASKAAALESFATSFALFLAILMMAYWVIAHGSARSFTHKKRNWPEGSWDKLGAP